MGLHSVEGDDRDRQCAVVSAAISTDGLAEVGSDVDLEQLRDRLGAIEARLGEPFGVFSPVGASSWSMASAASMVESGDRNVGGRIGAGFRCRCGRVVDGQSTRIPEWAPVDGERVLSTRDAYPPRLMPEHVVVVGSGVTGVEFVHMFESMGAEVTLVVSRQQVLPQDPGCAALEEDFLRGVRFQRCPGDRNRAGR